MNYGRYFLLLNFTGFTYIPMTTDFHCYVYIDASFKCDDINRRVCEKELKLIGTETGRWLWWPLCCGCSDCVCHS